MVHLYPRPLKLPVSQSSSATQVQLSRPHLSHHHDHDPHHHLPITRAPPVTSIPIWIFIPIPVPVPVPVRPVHCNSLLLQTNNRTSPVQSSSQLTYCPNISHPDSGRPCSKNHCPCTAPFCSRGRPGTCGHTNIFSQ